MIDRYFNSAGILFIGFILYVGYVALRDDRHVVSAIEMRNAVMVVGPR